MRVAVINETSAGDKNKDIVGALEGRGLILMNAGMQERGAKPELSYIHTGLMSALLLYARRVDFVVGGCGTGQGYLNSVMQYPGVSCGHILSDLDAWLFTQINSGNCISLALNQGYGWAGEVNLKFIFDRIFGEAWGRGFPTHRAEPQREFRQTLEAVNQVTHRPFAEIISALPDEILQPALEYPGFLDLLDVESIDDADLKTALKARLAEYALHQTH